MTQKDTKTRLLDVAEALFAKNGYANTSLRAVTGRAEANLASVNYHFGSKEALLTSVLARRLQPLNRLRRQRLEAAMLLARQQNRPPEAREILRAFIEPTMAFRNSGRGAKAFIIIISRALGDPDQTMRASFLSQIMPLMTYFSECLAAALPHLDGRQLFWRFHFMMGSLAHVMHGLDKKDLFPREMLPEEPDALVEMLLNFLTAGMEAAP
ncbi:TetR/AcrR family transcriptional regulator [Thiovibrio sp. JS02]